MIIPATATAKSTPDKIDRQEKFCWNLVTGSTFKNLNNAYEKIVH